MFYFLEWKKIRRRRTTRSDCHIHYSFVLPLTSHSDLRVKHPFHSCGSGHSDAKKVTPRLFQTCWRFACHYYTISGNDNQGAKGCLAKAFLQDLSPFLAYFSGARMRGFEPRHPTDRKVRAPSTTSSRPHAWPFRRRGGCFRRGNLRRQRRLGRRHFPAAF